MTATATTYSCGTSNAAALASRTTDRIIAVLEEIEAQPGELLVPDAEYHPVVAKALLVHAASWGPQGAELETLLNLPATDRRRQLSQLLGYGPVDLSRVASAERFRPVLLAAASIKKDKRDTYRYPLPPSLSTTTWWRRLTITLAWLSPVNTRSQRHRMARLSFSPPETDLRVHRTEGDWRAVRRGTVQHEILEGDSAVVFTAGDAMEINVDCRVDAGTLNGGAVRYALIASLEVAEQVAVDLHAEVRDQLPRRCADPCTSAHVAPTDLGLGPSALSGTALASGTSATVQVRRAGPDRRSMKRLGDRRTGCGPAEWPRGRGPRPGHGAPTR